MSKPETAAGNVVNACGLLAASAQVAWNAGDQTRCLADLRRLASLVNVACQVMRDECELAAA